MTEVPSILLRTGAGQKSEVSKSSSLRSAFLHAPSSLLLALTALLFALYSPTEAQPGKIYRVGYLDSSSLSGSGPFLEVFRQRLRDLGWVEGKNIAFEYRFGEGKGFERLKELATELVQIKVDLIVARATNGSQAAKQATSTIPIVMVGSGDPIAAGIIKSFARPGGNITGISGLSHELITKRLEVLKDVVPNLNLLGVLSVGRGGSVGTDRQIKELELAAQALQVKLLYLIGKHDPKELENAFETWVRKRVQAFVPTGSPGFFVERKRIADLAAKHRLPAVYHAKEFVDAGGLMSYGIDYPDQYRRAAYFVDRILKGSKPADLPVEHPMKFEFIINLKAAKQIGLTIPVRVLERANQVIK
jgi:putative ABC transport system substrate-binding protein